MREQLFPHSLHYIITYSLVLLVFSLTSSEVGIYKRKEESKKARKQENKKTRKQKNKNSTKKAIKKTLKSGSKHVLDQESVQGKNIKNFLFFLIVFLVDCLVEFLFSTHGASLGL